MQPAPNGWRAWRAILIVLVAIPVILGALWGLAAAIAWMIPGCRAGPSDGSCVVGPVDFEVPIALMSFPAMILGMAAPFWLAVTAAWILYGLVPAALWWASGRGFTLHPAFMLQGAAMRVPRLVMVGLLVLLYIRWCIVMV